MKQFLLEHAQQGKIGLGTYNDVKNPHVELVYLGKDSKSFRQRVKALAEEFIKKHPQAKIDVYGDPLMVKISRADNLARALIQFLKRKKERG